MFKAGDKVILKLNNPLDVPYMEKMAHGVKWYNDEDYREPISTSIASERYYPSKVYEIEEIIEEGVLKLKGMKSSVLTIHFESFKKYEFEQTLKRL
jgi:hypothetical protein